MGKNIILFILLLLMLGGAIWQSVYIHHATEALIDPLEQTKQALEQGNTDEAIQAAEDFNTTWQREKYTYEALFEHKEVDTISASAKKLTSLCTPDYIPEALATAEEILFYVDHIKAIDRMGWENIF